MMRPRTQPRIKPETRTRLMRTNQQSGGNIGIGIDLSLLASFWFLDTLTKEIYFFGVIEL